MQCSILQFSALSLRSTALCLFFYYSNISITVSLSSSAGDYFSSEGPIPANICWFPVVCPSATAQYFKTLQCTIFNCTLKFIALNCTMYCTVLQCSGL